MEIHPEFYRDLEQIWLFVAETSETAADHVVDDIMAAVQRIAQFPNVGHRKAGSGDILFVPVRRAWYVTYRRRGSGEPIVLRVVSARRDLKRLFE